MKKFSFLAIVATCVLLLSGCSAQFYQVSNQNLLETQVVLSQNNFKVIGRVEGSNTTVRVFGIGGLSKKAMQDNAISIMFQNANLRASQAIVNISFISAIAGVPPFYTETTYTATGTIIEFTTDSSSDSNIDSPVSTVSNIQPTKSIQEAIEQTNTTTSKTKNKKASQISKPNKETIKSKKPIIPEVSIKGTTYTEGDEVEYNGVKTKIVKIDDKQVILAIDSEKTHTWDDAMVYSKSIGKDWNLPTPREFKSIRDNIEPYYYWTCSSTHPQTAFYYDYYSQRCYDVAKNRNFYVLLVQSISIDDLK